MATFLDELEAIDDQLRKREYKTLPVPGTGGQHAARFRVPADDASLTQAVAAYKLQGTLNSEQAKQLLVDCCDEVLHRNGDGELVAVDPDGGPLRFDAGDERWGSKVKTARDCVAKFYHLDRQPLAHIGQADVLIDWLQGLDAEIAARVEGESDGGAAS